MPGEVIDTNVLFLASRAQSLDATPQVPILEPAALQAVSRWLSAFRADPERTIVLDRPGRSPKSTIVIEYHNKLRRDHYGSMVVAHKLQSGQVTWVNLEYEENGAELVAKLPDATLDPLIHDLGDRKMVSAAFAASAPIVNATDGDWEEAKVVEALGQLGVEVIQLLTPTQRAACKGSP
jgi:hypothetical protein